MHKLAKLLRRTPHSRDDHSYYPLSKSCQIPRLSMLYERYFGRKNDGFFVEVGAYDGEYVSNTSGLADTGWSGIYIEPVEDSYLKCLERHKKNTSVSVLQCAIGEFNGSIEISTAGPLSTIDDKTKERFKEIAWARDHFKHSHDEIVPQRTLHSLLVEQNVRTRFDLLVIDVEGYEWNVLKNFDLDAWRPKMVIIELHDQNSDYPHLEDSCRKIVQYFEEYQYKIVYKDFTNTIYVSSS